MQHLPVPRRTRQTDPVTVQHRPDRAPRYLSDLVDQVMTTAPSASAKRASWVFDNGSLRPGKASIDR
jgi:hypothetical protein